MTGGRPGPLRGFACLVDDYLLAWGQVATERGEPQAVQRIEALHIERHHVYLPPLHQVLHEVNAAQVHLVARRDRKDRVEKGEAVHAGYHEGAALTNEGHIPHVAWLGREFGLWNEDRVVSSRQRSDSERVRPHHRRGFFPLAPAAGEDGPGLLVGFLSRLGLSHAAWYQDHAVGRLAGCYAIHHLRHPGRRDRNHHQIRFPRQLRHVTNTLYIVNGFGVWPHDPHLRRPKAVPQEVAQNRPPDIDPPGRYANDGDGLRLKQPLHLAPVHWQMPWRGDFLKCAEGIHRHRPAVGDIEGIYFELLYPPPVLPASDSTGQGEEEAKHLFKLVVRKQPPPLPVSARQLQVGESGGEHLEEIVGIGQVRTGDLDVVARLEPAGEFLRVQPSQARRHHVSEFSRPAHPDEKLAPQGPGAGDELANQESCHAVSDRRHPLPEHPIHTLQSLAHRPMRFFNHRHAARLCLVEDFGTDHLDHHPVAWDGLYGAGAGEGTPSGDEHRLWNRQARLGQNSVGFVLVQGIPALQGSGFDKFSGQCADSHRLS